MSTALRRRTALSVAAAARRTLSSLGPDPYKSRAPLEGVSHVVAIASGKGGVGKSTTTCNLAVALSSLGLRVGLLDADIYGPSIPLLMGLPDEAPLLDSQNRMLAPAAHGVLACQSIGLLVKRGHAAAWRGPMVSGALEKLIRGTAWPALDVLLVDCPPGTGDAHLSLAQKLPLSGAVIVSTPQEVALIDARRGADFFRQARVPILGLVENMAWLQVGASPLERMFIFGEGGVARCAEQLGLDLLASVPLVQAVREASDGGTPLGCDAPGGAGEAYRTLAMALIGKLGLTTGRLDT
jgi:ATP-binding protein involved in chromosome partitioning